MSTTAKSTTRENSTTATLGLLKQSFLAEPAIASFSHHRKSRHPRPWKYLGAPALTRPRPNRQACARGISIAAALAAAPALEGARAAPEKVFLRFGLLEVKEVNTAAAEPASSRLTLPRRV